MTVRLGPPGLHFAVLGGLIWLAVQAWEDWQFRQVPAPSAAELEQLEHRWQQQHGQALDAPLRAALLRREIDERILFREALRQNLHRRDTVVLRRLRQDAEFLGLSGDGTELIQSALDLQLYLGDDVIRRRLLERMRTLASGNPGPADEAQLRALHRQQPEYAAPQYSFSQLFFRSAPDQAEHAEQRAKRVLQQILAGQPAGAGDAFLHGQDFNNLTASEINKRFGPEFAQALASLPGNTWHGPIKSAYGWHIVNLRNTRAPRPLSFEQRRPQLRAIWRRQQMQQQLDDTLTQLRQRYRVTS